MAARLVGIPTLDHPITIEPNPSRVVITLDSEVLADTRNTLTLREAAHATYCPCEGDRSYYSLSGGIPPICQFAAMFSPRGRRDD